MYQCPKCGKPYRHNGKWLKRHMIEVCHVRFLTPNELVVKNSVDLKGIIRRIEKLEILFKKGTPVADPIERIKQEEAEKITDPFLAEYRKAFKECITELKEVLKARKEEVEGGKLIIEKLELVEE